MKFPFVRRSRHEDLYERYQLALKQTAKAREKADTAHFKRQQVLAQNAGLDADNRRLHARNLELGRRISKLTEADPEYTAQLERRVARLRRIVSRLLTEQQVEKKRADRLQQRLDDAVGLGAGRVKDSSPWQPGYQKPKAGAS